MPKSLSSIKSQIEKLQKQLDAMQSGVIASIKKEIAQHGLTVADLFGSDGGVLVGNGRRSTAKSGTAMKGNGKRAPKFSDDQGNVWGGMGKRPQWIRDALDAGHSLDDFLVAGRKAAKPAPTAVKAKASAVKKAAKKTPAKRAVATTAEAPAAKTSAKTAAGAKSAVKKAPAKKAAKPATVKPAGKSSKKTVAKKSTRAASSAAPVASAEAPAT